jgi:hypothetical protein
VNFMVFEVCETKKENGDQQQRIERHEQGRELEGKMGRELHRKGDIGDTKASGGGGSTGAETGVGRRDVYRCIRNRGNVGRLGLDALCKDSTGLLSPLRGQGWARFAAPRAKTRSEQQIPHRQGRRLTKEERDC